MENKEYQLKTTFTDGTSMLNPWSENNLKLKIRIAEALKTISKIEKVDGDTVVEECYTSDAVASAQAQVSEILEAKQAEIDAANDLANSLKAVQKEKDADLEAKQAEIDALKKQLAEASKKK